MSILDFCQPVFEYICRLNRIAVSGGIIDQASVRSEVKALFEDLQSRAAVDLNLTDSYNRLELPLLFFVDSMIAESKLTFAMDWGQNRLAYERKEMAGDEKFFDLLEETVQDTSDEASERLAVFYTCIGLGFSGMYAGQPEQLRRFMVTAAPRIRKHVEADQYTRMCPEAYEGVDTRNLVEPPSRKMMLVAVVFAISAISVAVTYTYLYSKALEDVSDNIGQILEEPANH